MGSEIAREDYARPVRIGAVGVGGRGGGLLKILAGMEGVQIPAICDVSPEIVEARQNVVVKAGHKKPDGYSDGDYKSLRDIRV